MADIKKWLVGQPVSPERLAQLRAQFGQQDPMTRRAAIAGGAVVATGGLMPGDGLRRPVGAPVGQATPIGVQPGASGVTIARYVVVFGANGGVFVYDGAPIKGNPPIAWMSSGLTDPYGNTLPSTTGVAGSGTFEAGNTLITPAGMFVYSPTPGVGNLIASITSASEDPFGNSTTSVIAAYDEDDFVSLSEAQVVFSGGAFISAFMGNLNLGGAPVLFQAPINGAFVQVEPGTVSTPEAFHSLGTITGSGTTQFRARYMLSPDGQFCVIDIWLEAGAGGSTAGTYTFSNTLPAAYQFVGAGLRIYDLAFNADITTATENSCIVVDGNGTASPGRVRVTIPAVAANVWFNGTCFVPLT